MFTYEFNHEFMASCFTTSAVIELLKNRDFSLLEDKTVKQYILKKSIDLFSIFTHAALCPVFL